MPSSPQHVYAIDIFLVYDVDGIKLFFENWLSHGGGYCCLVCGLHMAIPIGEPTLTTLQFCCGSHGVTFMIFEWAKFLACWLHLKSKINGFLKIAKFL